MSGTIIVTGAAGGLGFAISETLLKRPEDFTCILTVRDKKAANAEPVNNLISANAAKRAETAELDLGSFESIRSFTDNINSRVSAGELPPVRALILNAAYVPVGPERKFANISIDGKQLEMNFAINLLAGAQLSLLLLKSLDKRRGRIVYVSSRESDPKQSRFSPEKLPYDLGDLAFPKHPPPPTDEANDAMRRYGMAKQCLIMFMKRLQERLDSTPNLNKICVIGVDPGAMVHPQMIEKYSQNSLFVKYVVGPAFMGYSKAAQCVWPNGLFRTVNKSATDVVRAAVGLEGLDGYPKGAYMNGSERSEPAEEAKDEKKQEEVWDFSLKLAKISEKDAGLR